MRDRFLAVRRLPLRPHQLILVIGALNDGLAPTLGQNAIRFSLLVIVASAFAAGVCLLIAGRFSDHAGKYVMHCHMLDHEDHGLMSQFETVV